MRRKEVVICLSFCVLLLSAVKIAILDNVGLLFVIAEGQNEPSFMHRLILKRIYKISQKRDVGKKIVDNIERNKHGYLYEQYVRVLGVTGHEQAAAVLVKMLIEYQNCIESNGLALAVIRSLGVVGDENVVPLLEKMISRPIGAWASSFIFSSLYILTGKNYTQCATIDSSQNAVIGKKLRRLRGLVMQTRDRKRNYKEMIEIDSLW